MEVSPLLIAGLLFVLLAGLLIALLAVFTVVRSGTQFRPAAHRGMDRDVHPRWGDTPPVTVT